MAELNFDAAAVQPAPEIAEPVATEIEVVEPPQLEQPKASKRKQGRPAKAVDPAIQAQRDAYKSEYAAYVEQCQEYKAKELAAVAELREGVAGKKEAMRQWTAHVDRLRLAVSQLRANSKPIAPVKPA